MNLTNYIHSLSLQIEKLNELKKEHGDLEVYSSMFFNGIVPDVVYDPKVEYLVKLDIHAPDNLFNEAYHLPGRKGRKIVYIPKI